MYECSICKNIVDNAVYNEHIKTHENICTENPINMVPILKLSNLKNGNWNRHFVYKCNICFEKFPSENNLIDHEKVHYQHSFNSDCIDLTINSNDSTVQTVPLNLIVKRKPKDLNIYTDDFSTRSSSNISNISSISAYNNYENKIQGKNISNFECAICKKFSMDQHSFALHMINHKENNRYDCIVCDIKFPTIILWTKHMMYHQEQIDLKKIPKSQITPNEIEPNISDTTNSENAESQVHIATLKNRKDEPSSNNMECELKNTYNNYITLDNSVPKQKQEFICNICKNIFTSKIGLTNHQCTHIKIREFSCKYCNKTFITKGPWINHEKTHIWSNNVQINNTESKKPELIETQNGINQYTCYICKNEFTNCCYWTNHMKVRHMINAKCPRLANYSSDSSNAIGNTYEDGAVNRPDIDLPVTEHTNFHENINQTLYCTVCNKQFSNASVFDFHMHIHFGNKPYKCRYCDKQFNTKGPFLVHEKTRKCIKKIKNVHGDPSTLKNQPIEMCNTSEELTNNNHENNNHDDPNRTISIEEEFKFSCDICDMRFSTPQTLFTHRKTHGRIKPHVCKICNTSYASKYHWNRHLKIHVKRTQAHIQKESCPTPGDNRNQCKICYKSFNNITNLRRHHTICHIVNMKAIHCSICGKTYKNEHSYKEHMRFKHKILLPNDVKISNDARQNIVPMSKNGIVNYFCKICKVIFSDYMSSMNHSCVNN